MFHSRWRLSDFDPQIFNEKQMSVHRGGREVTFPTTRKCGSMSTYLLRCGWLWDCNRSPLPPGKFLVLISVRRWVDPRAIARPEWLGQLEKSNDIGNRTCHPSACSIVSRPTMLPRAPLKTGLHSKFYLNHLRGYVTLSVSNFTEEKSSRLNDVSNMAFLEISLFISASVYYQSSRN
jgi:hypothetical protein